MTASKSMQCLYNTKVYYASQIDLVLQCCQQQTFYSEHIRSLSEKTLKKTLRSERVELSSQCQEDTVIIITHALSSSVCNVHTQL